jgi:hypothetical protein
MTRCDHPTDGCFREATLLPGVDVMTLEKLMDRPVLKNARTIVATVNSFVLLSSVAASVLVAFSIDARLNRTVLAATLSLFVGIALGALLYLRYRLQTFNPTFYRILRLEGILRVEPVGDYRRYHYARRQRIQATHDDVRLIELREHWTGKGSRDSLTVRCVRPTDAVLMDGKVPEEDGRVHRWVYPTRPLGRGEHLEVEVHQTHIDDVETQRPYFRQGGGRYDTESICVQVCFPAGYEPVEIHGGVWNTGRPLLHNQLIETIDCARTEDRTAGTITYTVEWGRMSHHHSVGLYWVWPERTASKTARRAAQITTA